MAVLTDVSCPLCRADTEAYTFGPPSLALRRCCSCTIVFLANALCAPKYVEQMQDQFFSTGFLVRQSEWQKLFNRLNAYRTLRRIRRFKQGGRLLEIGIGNGAFLHVAKQAGFECAGVEPSPIIVGYVKNAYNVPVFNGYLEDFARSPMQSTFDVIVINHVLEHIPNPRVALKQVRSLLADKGIAHIAVPNIAGWESRLPGWTSYETYHLYYFSPSTLLSLLSEVGFEVLRLETVEPFSGWFNALVRTMLGARYQVVRASAESSRGREKTSLRWFVMSSALNTGRIVFGLLTFPIRLTQARLNKGEELVAVVAVR